MKMENQNTPQQQQIIPLALVGIFIAIQLLLIIVLWLMSGRGEIKPSWSEFVASVSNNLMNQALLIAAGGLAVAQQSLKAKFLSDGQPTLAHLVILLAVAEIPGLLGFVLALVSGFNVSLALPFIFLSLILFMTVKPVALQLMENIAKKTNSTNGP